MILPHCFQAKHGTRPKGLGIDPEGLMNHRQPDIKYRSCTVRTSDADVAAMPSDDGVADAQPLPLLKKGRKS